MVRSFSVVTTVISCASANYMECGSGVPLCGVLTLGSGYGTGYYESDVPTVHGLWPQVGQYGTSRCDAPQDSTDPQQIYSCYQNYDDLQHQLEFEDHEWDKHGKCAAVNDVEDYFNQICSLSSAPLQLMAEVRAKSPGDFPAMKAALEYAGYPVWGELSDTEEVLLSACAKSDGQWQLAQVSEFGTACFDDSPSPTPSPSPAGGQCVPSTHGPQCSSDADCEGVEGCVRCAGSGYCTDVPRAMVI